MWCYYLVCFSIPLYHVHRTFYETSEQFVFTFRDTSAHCIFESQVRFGIPLNIFFKTVGSVCGKVKENILWRRCFKKAQKISSNGCYLKYIILDGFYRFGAHKAVQIIYWFIFEGHKWIK